MLLQAGDAHPTALIRYSKTRREIIAWIVLFVLSSSLWGDLVLLWVGHFRQSWTIYACCELLGNVQTLDTHLRSANSGWSATSVLSSSVSSCLHMRWPSLVLTCSAQHVLEFLAVPAQLQFQVALPTINQKESKAFCLWITKATVSHHVHLNVVDAILDGPAKAFQCLLWEVAWGAPMIHRTELQRRAQIVQSTQISSKEQPFQRNNNVVTCGQ